MASSTRAVSPHPMASLARGTAQAVVFVALLDGLYREVERICGNPQPEGFALPLMETTRIGGALSAIATGSPSTTGLLREIGQCSPMAQSLAGLPGFLLQVAEFGVRAYESDVAANAI